MIESMQSLGMEWHIPDFSLSILTILLRPVVRNADSAVHWINNYPLDSAIGFPNTYPVDSDFSDG